MGEWEKWERKDSNGDIHTEYIRKTEVSDNEVYGIDDDSPYDPTPKDREEFRNTTFKIVSVFVIGLLVLIHLFSSGHWVLGIIGFPIWLGYLIGLACT
jgi:hypothetical protein